MSKPDTQQMLQESVGGVDDANQRITDDEWRALVVDGSLPPRPSWVTSFMGE